MKVVAINSSPRKHFNTASLVDSFLRGVKAAVPDADTMHVHLYDLQYKGCISCMSCKLKDGKNYGHCSLRDDITPIIEAASTADILLFASPIYFGDINGTMHSFLERLLFAYESYEIPYRTLAPRRMQVVTLYTMNVTEDMFIKKGYHAAIDMIERFIGNVFSLPHRICAYNTSQVKDYSRYRIESFSATEKQTYCTEHWETDLSRTYEKGRKMAEEIVGKINE